MKAIDRLYTYISLNAKSLKNAGKALSVVKCLQYLRDYSGLVAKRSGTPEAFADEYELKNGILRTSEGFRFQVKNPRTNQPIDFKQLINEVESSAEYIFSINNPEFTNLFIDNIHASESNCMYKSFGKAIEFAKIVKENKGIRKFTFHFLKFIESYESIPGNKIGENKTQECLKALEYFGPYIRLGIPVYDYISVDMPTYDQKISTLTWTMVRNGLQNFLKHQPIDWISLFDSTKPYLVDGWLCFYFDKETDARIYLNYLSSFSPEACKYARVSQDKSGYSFFLKREHYLLCTKAIEEQKKSIKAVNSMPVAVVPTQTIPTTVVDEKTPKKQTRTELPIRMDVPIVVDTLSLDQAVLTTIVFKNNRIFVKSIRGDHYGFFREFALGITQSEKQNKQSVLRPAHKGIYTVKADGVHRRATKKPVFKAEEKKGFSKLQSVSFASDFVETPVFGHKRHQRKKEQEQNLVGIRTNLSNVLLGRMMIYDNGTVHRNTDAMTLKKAIEIHTKMTDPKNPKLFDDIDLFEATLADIKNKDSHNEVMARLRWNLEEEYRITNSNGICIFTDNLGSRLLAKDYARILYHHLRAKKLEDNEPWDKNYRIPITFYLPRNKKNNEYYTHEDYKKDCTEATRIFRNEKECNELIDNQDYCFLLGLEDTREAMEAQWNGKPLFYKLISEGYLHIAMSLIEKDSQQTYLQLTMSVSDITKINSVYNTSPFIHAIRLNALPIVNWFLKHPQLRDIAKKFDDGTYNALYSPLCMAAQYGHVELIKLLLEHKCFHTDQASIYAARHGHNEVLKILAEHSLLYAEPKSKADRKKYSYSPLTEAITNGYTDTALRLINLEENQNAFLGVALGTAALFGNEKVALALIGKGTDVNYVTSLKDGNLEFPESLLAIAANEGHIEVLRVLLTHGAKLNTDIGGSTTAPLYFAAKEGHFDCVDLLLDYGADVNQVQEDGSTALSEAITNRHYRVVERLMERRIDFAKHKKINLSSAVDSNSAVLVSLALKHGFKDDGRRGNNSTNLDRAAFFGNEKIIRQLLKSKLANPQHRCKDGRTALHYAAESGSIAAVDLLLQAGIEIDCTDQSGVTPLDIAAKFNHWKLVKHLLEKGAQQASQESEVGKLLKFLNIYAQSGNDIKHGLSNGSVLSFVKHYVDPQIPQTLAKMDIKQSNQSQAVLIQQHGALANLPSPAAKNQPQSKCLDTLKPKIS